MALSSPLLYNAASGLSGKAPELVLPKSGKCIKEAGWMRDNHMKLLMQTRDDVVRRGIRKANHGIQGCRSCHVNRDEFCDRCHNYVGIEPECWSCHYYPTSDAPEKTL